MRSSSSPSCVLLLLLRARRPRRPLGGHLLIHSPARGGLSGLGLPGVRTLSTTHRRGRRREQSKEEEEKGGEKGSDLLPSFTTSDEGFHGFIKTPGFDIISNVIMQGKANLPFTRNLGVTPEEFSNGALHAMEVVTTHLAREDNLELLSDQLTPQCRYKLSNSVLKMPRDLRKKVEIHQQDVFLSWIAKAASDKKTGEVEIFFVAFSMPGVSDIKQELEENNKRAKAFMDDLKRRSPGLREAKKEIDEFKADVTDPLAKFKRDDFVCSNFQFVHREGSWRMDEVAMKPSSELYLAPFHWRWKSRLSFYLRGLDFLQVLRYDYITDTVLFVLIFAYILA